MPVIPNDQPPLYSSEVEKLDERFIFSCKPKDLRRWQSLCGRRSLSYVIRTLLNAWAADKIKRAQR